MLSRFGLLFAAFAQIGLAAVSERALFSSLKTANLEGPDSPAAFLGWGPNKPTSLEELFTLFDKDGNGFVCKRELAATMLDEFGEVMTLEETKEMIWDAQTESRSSMTGPYTNRGYRRPRYDERGLSFDKFVLLLEQSLGFVETHTLFESDEKELRETFELADLDRDGYISKADMKGFIRNSGDSMSDAEVEELFSPENDLDRDGKLNFEEFVRVLA